MHPLNICKKVPGKMHEEDGGQADPSRNSRVLATKSLDVAEPDSPKEETPKLCGYLNKLAGKGPLRGFKTRWFVYDPRKCYLYYFKSPQDALPLGHIEIADACFSYDVEGEEGQFEIRTAGKEFLLKAPNKQVMQYWLQQLQQKRWDFCNTRGAGTVRDSWSSPTSLYPLTGLVAKDAGPVAGVLCEKPTESMESVRNDFAVETETNGLVGIGSARQHTAPLTPALSSLKNWGSEIRNSMSHLRQRGGENRRSVFYTASQQQAGASTGSSGSAEDWEMLDHPTNPAAKEHHGGGGGVGPPSSTEPSRRDSPSSHFHRHSIGSAFTFDFRSTGGRMKRPFLRDGLLGSVRGSSGSGRSGSADLSPSQVECNGSKQSSELQLRLQSQQEELSRMQEEQTRLREELAGQKELVRLLQQTLRGSQCGPGSIPGSALVGHRPPPPPPLPPGGAPEAKGGPGAGGAGAEPGPGPGAGLRGDGAGDAYAQAAQAKAEAWRQEREGHIQALCGHMERLGLEKESLQQELKTLKNKVGEINEQLGMLMETIQAKDEVIIKLSQSGGDDAGSQGEASSPTGYRDQHELGNLKDSLEGYKSQNNFLNKEILELTVLRRNAESREKAIEAKYTALEAKLCQVESKYLVLLQEVKTPVGATSDVITRLLEDALEVETCSDQPEHTLLKPHTVSEYDTYGFKTLPEEEDEEEKLVAKVRALDLKKLSLTDQEVSVSVKWDNYLAGTMNREMARSPELKALIRSGVPHVHRPKVWRWCVWLHIRKFRECLAEDYYRGLLSLAREKQNPASKQIELDLLRTLPNNKHYASPSSHGIQQLRNVLLAFSWRNPDIGYCQGLNRLAAIALLYLEEEDAFWCLTAIVEVFMPRDYYTKTLLGSQVDQRVFKDLMSEKLPRLHAHFEQYKVDFSLITFNWFLVVFVDSVVSDILFKIWDAFLFEGPKIIFRFALSLFKYKEEEFLKLQDSMAIFKYLRYFTRTILDSRKLMNIAFVDMNPFPLRQIQNRRMFHLEKVRLELTELEAIRQTFLRERENSQQGRSDLSDDEEDN